MVTSLGLFFFRIIYLFICLSREREREREQELKHKQGERQAEGEVGSSLSKERDVGLNPRSRDPDLSQRSMLNRLSHPGVPQFRDITNEAAVNIPLRVSV